MVSFPILFDSFKALFRRKTKLIPNHAIGSGCSHSANHGNNCGMTEEGLKKSKSLGFLFSWQTRILNKRSDIDQFLDYILRVTKTDLHSCGIRNRECAR